MTVGAVVAAVFAIRDGGPTVPGAGIAPASFVVSSTQNTLDQHSADVIFSGSITAAGKVIPMQGTGQTDFTSNAFSGTVNASSSGTSLIEKELVVGGHFYLGLSIDGTPLSQFTGGAEWIDIPVPDQSGSNSPGLGNVDPLSQIQTLEKKGITVVNLGTSVIDGYAVSGYSVTPSHLEELGSVEQEMAAGQITAAQGKQILNAAKTLGTFTSDVWIDSSGLLRRETVNVGGGTSGEVGKVDMTFVNYGTPVSIAAPPSNEIVGFTQFQSDMQALEKTAQ
jgi:hypothetical protein